jgi:hypothetical protein
LDVTAQAPIVLFIYNRPVHARQALERLAACAGAVDSNLIVYADGPRSGKDRDNVRAAREAARDARGFKSVTLVEQDRNLGLAESIISGVTEVCRLHGRAIVIEDDLLVAPELLQFLNSGLERYAAEPRVLQISGYAYPAHAPGAADAFFLPMVSCWGWATWVRAWEKFERSLTALPALDRDRLLRRRFNVDGTYDYYAMACDQRAGRINSWGICWQLSLFTNDGLVLYPSRSLVTNAGFDGSGTHRTTGEAFQEPLDPSPFDVVNLSWPAVAETDVSAYGEVKRMLSRNRPGVVRRLARWLRA